MGKTQFDQERAVWYDEYKRKFYNYESDADNAASIIRRYNPDSRKILEPGIGTAKFSIPLSRRGFDVDGIDNAPSMLDFAKKNIRKEKATGIRLSPRKCQNMILEGTNLRPPYDATVSHGLFYFIGQTGGYAFASYLLGREENRAAFERIHKYLKSDGLLLINTIRDYKPEKRNREPVNLGKGGIWHVTMDLSEYDSDKAELKTTYRHEMDGKVKEYTFVKSVFKKEDIETDLKGAGFEFLEHTMNKQGNHGFYVLRRNT